MLHELTAPLVVRDVAELQALRVRLPRSPVALQLPGIAPDEARAAGERIESYRNECGCDLGAKCMALGFFATLAALVLRHGIAGWTLVTAVLWAALCSVMCAGVGKAIGIARARTGLRREIDRLIDVQRSHAIGR